LFGHSTTALAELALAETAKGRGFSLPWQIRDGTLPVSYYFKDGAEVSDSSFRAESTGTVPIHHLLRDLHRKELRTYLSLISPPLADMVQQTAKMKSSVVSHKDLSIEETVARYFEEVEENYPSIVANVVRTTGKLNRVVTEEHCGICAMPLDKQGDRRWKGEIGSDSSSASSGAGRSIQLCYGCERSIHS
jgi:cytoplasmic tRNA 2-thiolation protein 2